MDTSRRFLGWCLAVSLAVAAVGCNRYQPVTVEYEWRGQQLKRVDVYDTWTGRVVQPKPVPAL